MTQESTAFTVMKGSASYQLSGGDLTITEPGQAVILSFHQK